MEKKPYEAPSADEIKIEETDILSESQIKTNVEGSAGDNSWSLFDFSS